MDSLPGLGCRPGRGGHVPDIGGIQNVATGDQNLELWYDFDDCALTRGTAGGTVERIRSKYHRGGRGGPISPGDLRNKIRHIGVSH